MVQIYKRDGSRYVWVPDKIMENTYKQEIYNQSLLQLAPSIQAFIKFTSNSVEEKRNLVNLNCQKTIFYMVHTIKNTNNFEDQKNAML